MSSDRGPTLEHLRSLVTERLGLLLDEGRRADVDAVLRDRVERCAGGSMARYLALLEHPADPRELHALAERVMVGETYFFRNPSQLDAFAGAMLPERLPAALARGRLAILSAGCSSGEEAYTLAMLARDQLRGASACSLEVTGVDVNPAAIAKARRGCYREWSLRQVPPDVRDREFRREGREYCVDPSVRRLVRFEVGNLLDLGLDIWQPGAYDVVFFRNVAMYLTPEVFRDVAARCAACLAPGGFLVLGDAESLRGVSSAFALRHSHGAFYYQLDARRERSVAPPRPSAGGAREVVDDGAWVEAIRTASERIERLARRAPAPGAPSRPTWDLDGVLDLLRQERLDAAQEALEALPSEAAQDLDALLLRAVILTNRGLVDEAEATCLRLLDVDGLNAGAHYLRALCRQHRGDRAGAAEHDRRAAHLDPTFAMPRLHLGLLARDGGDHEAARRELARAAELLAQEDAARLLLFGGGFTREALLSVCRTELQRSEP